MVQYFRGAIMIKVKVNKSKRIAIVAHDNRKDELLNWLESHIEVFKKHEISGTGTTSSLIRNRFNIDVKSYLSGPMGGDQQLGAAIAQGEIDVLFFFWDPLEAQPHDPDVKALLRIAVLYDIPVAQSVSGANFLIQCPLFNESYEKEVLSQSEMLQERVKELSQQTKAE